MQITINVPILPRPADTFAAGCLRTFLWGRNYSPAARDLAARFVEACGCLPEHIIEPEDRAAAELVLERSFEPIDHDDPAWNDESVLFVAEWLQRGEHPAGLAPISGGCDFEPSEEDRSAAAAMFAEESEPFIPSDADWRDYHQHFDRTEPPVYGWE